MNFFIPAAAVHWGDNPNGVSFGAIERLFVELASDKVALIVILGRFLEDRNGVRRDVPQEM